jgi:hypothetical protein
MQRLRTRWLYSAANYVTEKLIASEIDAFVLCLFFFKFKIYERLLLSDFWYWRLSFHAKFSPFEIILGHGMSNAYPKMWSCSDCVYVLNTKSKFNAYD